MQGSNDPLRPFGSSMAVGSSRMMHCGRIAMTPAMATLCFCPPDSLLGDFKRYAVMPTASRLWSTLPDLVRWLHKILRSKTYIFFHNVADDLVIRVLEHHTGSLAGYPRYGHHPQYSY